MIAEGKLAEAQPEIDFAGRLSAHDESAKLSLDITSARLSAKKNQTSESLHELALVMKRAVHMKLVGYQLMARLAQAEVRAAAGEAASARSDLRRLKTDATGLGFQLVARKAVAAENALQHVAAQELDESSRSGGSSIETEAARPLSPLAGRSNSRNFT